MSLLKKALLVTSLMLASHSVLAADDPVINCTNNNLYYGVDNHTKPQASKVGGSIMFLLGKHYVINNSTIFNQETVFTDTTGSQFKEYRDTDTNRRLMVLFNPEGVPESVIVIKFNKDPGVRIMDYGKLLDFYKDPTIDSTIVITDCVNYKPN